VSKKRIFNFTFRLTYEQGGGLELPDTEISEQQTSKILADTRNMLERSVRHIIGFDESTKLLAECSVGGSHV